MSSNICTLKKIVHQILQKYDSRIQAIREQSVTQFLKLLADHAERFRNNSKIFCNF